MASDKSTDSDMTSVCQNVAYFEMWHIPTLGVFTSDDIGSHNKYYMHRSNGIVSDWGKSLLGDFYAFYNKRGPLV